MFTRVFCPSQFSSRRRVSQLCMIKMVSNENLIFKTKEKFQHSITDWIDFYQKNKPQTNALSIGIMVMVYSGSQFAWGNFNNHLTSQPWAGGYEDEGEVFWAISSWFIAAIVGFFFTSIFLVNRKSKLSIYLFSSVFALSSASLLIVKASSLYYLIPSRILAGFAHGLAYPALLIHASEVACNRIRGYIIGTIHLCFVVGILVSSSYHLEVYKTRSYDYDPTQQIGITGVVTVLTGMILGVFFTRESPVFLLKRGRESEAESVMMSLRSESTKTSEIQRDLEDFKLLIKEDSMASKNIFSCINIKSLAIVTLMKFGLVASFNIILNSCLLEAVETVFYDGNRDWSPIILSTVRLIMTLVAMIAIDFKRLQSLKASTFVSSILLLSIGLCSLVFTYSKQGAFINMILGMLLQAFTVVIGLLGDVYSAEAFDTAKKPISIALTSALEFGLHILLVYLNFHLILSLATLIVIMAVTMILLAVTCYKIPDTTNTSLRTARKLFYTL